MMLFVYATLVFLVLRFCVTLFNFLSNPKLGYYGKHFTDKVSILILTSAADSDLSALHTSIENQDYKNIEIIAQGGESITESAGRATGKYLLLLAPGTTISYGLINNLIYRTKVFNLAVLSLIPTYKAIGFLENCSCPLNDYLSLTLFPLRLVRLSNLPAFAAGSDECMFFDAAIYRQFSWHEKVEYKFSAAAEIVKMVKQEQLEAEVLLGNKFVYNVVPLSREGNARRLLMNFGNNKLVIFIYLLLVIAGPIVVLMNFNLALAVLPFGLIFLSRVMIAFLTSQNPVVQVILHPLQMILLTVLMIKGAIEKPAPVN